jgi:two-component system OmpR family response regulator
VNFPDQTKTGAQAPSPDNTGTHTSNPTLQAPTPSSAPLNGSERILVVEDDPDIASLIRLNLQSRFAEVVVASHGLEGFDLAVNQNWSLMVLDLQLPGKDGLEICRDLRGRGIPLPVLMLTSRSSEMDRVLGLEMGADDYLLKPFSVIELIARIKAILRRSSFDTHPAPNHSDSHSNEPQGLADTIPPANWHSSAHQMPQFAEKPEELVNHRHHLLMDLKRNTASKSGRRLELTAKEFDLLSYFMQNPEDAFSRAHLLDRIWGKGQQGYEHTVNSHINRLRAKIEDDPSNPRIIVTVWGVGYRLG